MRPRFTHFATSYLTLECLLEHRSPFRMFTSDEWKNSHFANTRDGSSIEDVVLYKECLTGAFLIASI